MTKVYKPVTELRIEFTPTSAMVAAGSHVTTACGDCAACAEGYPHECMDPSETLTTMVGDTEVTFDVIEEWPFYTGEIAAEKEHLIASLGCMITGEPYAAPMNQKRSRFN